MVFIDEVQNYLHLPTPIEDVLSTSRSYGVGWHLAHQYRHQLPDKLRKSLDANARSKICFALDPDDAHDMARQAPELTAGTSRRCQHATSMPSSWLTASEPAGCRHGRFRLNRSSVTNSSSEK
jgi:hypothetical protein